MQTDQGHSRPTRYQRQHHAGARVAGAWHIGLWLAAAALSAPAGATSAEAPPTVAAAAWSTVDDATLEGARGGFTVGNGLTISLGIDRLVSINGDVVAHSNIDLNNLGGIGAEQVRQTSAALSSVKLVQNGDANIYRAGAMDAALGGIVVQNSLNNQLIRTDTVISAAVNSASLLSALNFQGNLQDALTRAVASH